MTESGFSSTRWSLVLAAGRAESPDSEEALAWLCRSYWRPMYSYVRRRGHSVEEAEDLTQEFFCRLLERGSLADVDRRRGRFRSFLLACMKHFLANDWRRERALKRGGGAVFSSLDVEEVERVGGARVAGAATPERLYERAWAMTLIERSLERLRVQYESNGNGELYSKLRFTLTSAAPARPYDELASELGVTNARIRTAVHRLRRRYQALLKEEIAQTVSSPGEVDEELRYLMTVVTEPD